MLNYFLYARKSTDIEDKQVRSIEDQLAVLRALAQRESLNIIDEFVEKQSAKRPGRPVFGKMLARIGKEEAQGVVCWKLDRLARNPVDAAQISWLLQEGTIQHIQTYDRSYRPSDNVMMMQVEFGMANQYIRDLSENTKRGLYEKVRRGEYPSLAPVGYINDLRTKTIVVDRVKAPIIKEAFELYAQNNSRLEDIAMFLFERGIKTRKSRRWNSDGGRPLKKDQVTYILSNPLYCGLFRYAKEIHPGNHETIISKQLFDRVQKVLKLRGKIIHKVKGSKPLCGLLRCGECGRSITGEAKTKNQKNGNVHHYLYYRCTKKDVVCSQDFIRGEELDRQLTELLKNYVLPPEWAEELLKMTEKDNQESARSVAVVVQELRRKIGETDIKLQRLLDAYLEQDIEREHYRDEKNALVSEKKSLEEQIARLERNRNIWLEPLKNWLKDAQTLDGINQNPSLSFKKFFSQKVFGSNLLLQNKKVVSVAQTQWAALAAAREKNSKLPLSFPLVELYESLRTHFIKNS